MPIRSITPCLAIAACATVAFAQISLKGIVDIHVHCDPDSVPRSIDAFDVARKMKDEGVRAILLKNHFMPTAQLAYAVNKTVPGIQAFGGVVLNRSVGGLNPAAIEQMAKVKGGYGRVVWMPTFESENHLRSLHSKAPFVRVSRDGKLVPEVYEVLKAVVREKLAFETGHLTPAEDLMVIRAARDAGIRRIVVTHAMAVPVEMNIDQMKEAVRLGAQIEFCFNQVYPGDPQNTMTFADYARAIHAIGAENSILSTDAGQPTRPLHPEAWRQYIEGMTKAGITPHEIDLMARRNPARFVGLE